LKHEASSNLIQVYAKPNALAYARLGLIVSKRIERHAVKRNRIKRILRETFRVSRQDEQIKTMDWVIRLRRPVIKHENELQLITETRLLMLKLVQCHD